DGRADHFAVLRRGQGREGGCREPPAAESLVALSPALYPGQRPPTASGASTARKNGTDREGGWTHRPTSRGGVSAVLRPRRQGRPRGDRRSAGIGCPTSRPGVAVREVLRSAGKRKGMAAHLQGHRGPTHHRAAHAARRPGRVRPRRTRVNRKKEESE